MQEGLWALAVLTEVSDRDARDVFDHLVPDSRPPPPEAEKLLPVVHTTWGFMTQGLALPAPAARSEAAARLLAHVAELAGGFIAPRFAKDALPPLLRLMRGGGAVARTAGAGVEGGRLVIEEAAAAGTRERQQRAAMACIADCCVSAEARHVVSGVVERAAVGALEGLAAAGSAAVAEAALRCLRALAGVDADTLWLLLLRVLHSQRADTLRDWTKGEVVPGLVGLEVCRGGLGAAWRGENGAWVRQCAKLVIEVEGMQVAWHAEIEAARERTRQASTSD
jgi:hypothetical protein